MACEMPLYNIGMEKRSIEPQPCGKKTEFFIQGFDLIPSFDMKFKAPQFVDKPTKSCSAHVGGLVKRIMNEHPTTYFQITPAGVHD